MEAGQPTSTIRCLHCRYDLTGLVEEQCPECGRAFRRDDPTTFMNSGQFLSSFNRRVRGFGIALVKLELLGFSGIFVFWLWFGGFIAITLMFVGFVLALVTGAVLMMTGSPPGAIRRREKQYALLAMLIPPIMLFGIGPPTVPVLERWRNEVTIHRMEALIAEIEAFRRIHGRFPRDEAELLTTRGKAMPKSAWGDELDYHCDGDSFVITCWTARAHNFLAMIYAYDSRDPHRGIVVESF